MEKYEVQFLGCFSEPVPKETFIQHITEIVHVKYDRTTTYGSGLNLLKDKIQNDSKKEAVQKLHDFFSKSILEGKIIPPDDEIGEGYMAFNIYKSNGKNN